MGCINIDRKYAFSTILISVFLVHYFLLGGLPKCVCAEIRRYAHKVARFL